MVDFITKLLLVAEKNAILVVYNRLSKMAYFVATTEETMVEGLVRCYELKLKVLSNRTTLVLSNTRELNRDLFYKVVYLIYYYQWSVLTTVHPTVVATTYPMINDSTGQ